MFNKKMFIALSIIVLLTLSACSTDNTIKEPSTQTPAVGEQNPANSNSNDVTVQEGDETMITPMAAFDIYLEKFPTTKVRKIEFDSDMDVYYYKVKGYENNIEYELKLDSVNGDVIKEDSEKENDLDKHGEILKADLEKIDKYVNKVLDDAGEGSTLDEWTIKAKNGRALLEVEVDLSNGNDLEHTYDVNTGELVEIDD